MPANQPRIAPLPPADWDEDLAKYRSAMLSATTHAVHNIFKTLANHPKLLKRWLPFANHTLFKTSLEPRARELIILRVAMLTHCSYEWHQHREIAARDVGMDQADFAAIMAGPDDSHWSTGDATLLRAIDELHGDHRIGEATWQALSDQFEQMQMMDICATVGNYTCLAGMLNSFGVPLDDWLEQDADFPG